MESIPMPMPVAPPAEVTAEASDVDQWSEPGDTLSPGDLSDDDSEGLPDAKASRGTATIATLERTLASAAEFKEKGNQKLRETNFVEASALYAKGVKKLSKIKEKSRAEGTWTEQEWLEMQQKIRNAQVALNLNACLAHLKKGSWAAAVASASEVLKLDPSNVKGLYRRACAYRDCGRYEEAKSDLLKCTQLDPNNMECRRELAQMKRQELEAKARDRKAFAGLFGKATGLYEDRERAARQREEAAQREQQRLREEFEEQKRRRMAAGETTVESFEEWRDAREAAAKKQSAGEKPRKNAGGTAARAVPVASSPSLELDEDDQKIVQETKKMGYCYFNRKVDETASSVLQSVPIRLEPTASTSSLSPTSLDGTSSAPVSVDDSSNNNSSLSSWNKAGKTYEERDVTSWASSSLRKSLGAVQVSWTGPGDFGTVAASLKVTAVETLEGEAQIVILRGTKRYLYDFKIVLKWHLEWTSAATTDSKINNQTEQRGSCSGTLTLCDVGAGPSARVQPKTTGLYPPIDWLREASFTVSGEKSSTSTNGRQVVRDACERLKGEIFRSVCLFEDEFQSLA